MSDTRNHLTMQTITSNVIIFLCSFLATFKEEAEENTMPPFVMPEEQKGQV